MIGENEKSNQEDNGWKRWKVKQGKNCKKLKKTANDMTQKELL